MQDPRPAVRISPEFENPNGSPTQEGGSSGSRGNKRPGPRRSRLRVRARPELRTDRRRKDNEKHLGKRDQFAPELLYFSDCILRNRSPEPSGEEGLQDVRIVEALYRSAKTGRAVKLPPFTDTKKPTQKQKIRRPGIRKPNLIKVL